MNAVAEAFRVVGEIISELVSASQIDKFDECERKWGWRYIAKLREEQGAAAALGTECDDTQLQPYLRDGRAIDYSRRSGYIVQPGLPFLPKPQSPGIELQRHFVIPGGQRPVYSGLTSELVGYTTPRFGIQGFVDLWCPDGSVMPLEAYDPKQGQRTIGGTYVPPALVDFKTTGNWKYQKHAKELATDTQAQLYASWALRETGSRVVDLIWVYFATKGATRAKASHFRAHGDHVAEQFERIDGVAKKIHQHRRLQTHPLQLVPNPLACGKFGGCPYESKCNLSPGQKTDAAAAQYARRMDIDMNAASSTADLLARLKGQQTPPAPAAPAAPAAPYAPAWAATPEGVPGSALPSWATAPVDPLTGSSRPLGINPPESELPPAPPVGTVAAPPASAEAPAPKKGPGRPRKDKTAEVAEAPAVGESLSMLELFSVTWAKEKFSPLAYNDFDIGPFEASGSVRDGETLSQAMARVYGTLEAFAEEARARKAVSYQKTLTAMGGAR